MASHSRSVAVKSKDQNLAWPAALAGISLIVGQPKFKNMAKHSQTCPGMAR